ADLFRTFLDILEFIQVCRAAYSEILAALFCNSLKKTLADPLLVLRQLVVSLVRVERERFSHCSDRLVMFEVDRFGIVVAVFGPIRPRAHERVLKDRELVGIVAQIIQQLLCETGGNGPTTNSDGSFYRRSLLIAGKLGNEVVAVVDLARQLRELGTVSNKVRTHCNSNVD